MAAEKTLANPTVQVNDVTIGIVPNSVSYKSGKGDRNVRAESAGGDSVDVVVTENAETKVSMVKFKLYNTKSNDEKLRGWQTNADGNTIQLSDGDFVRSFASMYVTSDPEIAVGADGEIEIEFMGKASL